MFVSVSVSWTLSLTLSLSAQYLGFWRRFGTIQTCVVARQKGQDAYFKRRSRHHLDYISNFECAPLILKSASLENFCCHIYILIDVRKPLSLSICSSHQCNLGYIHANPRM